MALSRSATLLLLTLYTLLAFSIAQESPYPLLKAKLLKNTGIELCYKPLSKWISPRSPIQGREIQDEPSLEKYLPLLEEELLLYPPAFLKKSALKRIILCQELSYLGQLRAGIPGMGTNTLWLDISAGHRGYLRKVFHHELFHQVDFRDDGQVYQDSKWAKLNNPSFQYGSGGKNMRDSGAALLRYDLEGFLNRYSTSGIEEDKAELFCHLFLFPEKVLEFARRDKILQKKIVFLKKLLQDFCPELDESFWEKRLTAPVHSDYWMNWVDLLELDLETAKKNLSDPKLPWIFRRTAARSIGRAVDFRTSEKEALDCLALLQAALQDNEEGVQVEVVWAIGEFGARGSITLASLMELLEKNSRPLCLEIT